MTRALAALALVFALAIPVSASAESNWELIKEEWELRPWAVILASPALLITAPFMLIQELMEDD
jgi:hypothetical protein